MGGAKIYRGVNTTRSVMERYRKGDRVFERPFSSYTRNIHKGKDWSTGNGARFVLVLKTKSKGSRARNIKDLSKFKAEDEVLLLPKTSLYVTKRYQKGPIHYIHLHEI